MKLKFVLRLEEKLQLTENYKHEPQTSTWQIQREYLRNNYKEEYIFNYIRDFDMFDSLADKLVKSNSLEAKCDECEYIGRNAARVVKHKEVKHVHNCEVCEDEFVGDTNFEKHKKLVHLHSDILISEK